MTDACEIDVVQATEGAQDGQLHGYDVVAERPLGAGHAAGTTPGLLWPVDQAEPTSLLHRYCRVSVAMCF